MRTPRQTRLSRVHSDNLPAIASRPSRRQPVAISPERLTPEFWWTAAGWVLLTAIIWALSATPAAAQLPQTRLYALFPTGGQVGTTFDLSLTRGDDLDEVDRLLFSHPGIKATAKTTQNIAGNTDLVPNQFTVAIDANVPPGHYEVRAVGLFGISNPRTFVVGTRGEVSEVEPNNTLAQATPIEIGQTVNARITGATDVDFYKFAGQAGQRVIVDCVAQRIDSRLDAAVELQDASGRRLAMARNNLSKDAVLDYTLPAAGEYFVRVTDFVYAGSEDYFFRLTVSTSAIIDFVDPPAGVPGTTAKYTLYGRNLPQGQPTDVKLDGRALQKQVVDIALPNDPTSPPLGMVIEPYAAGVDGFPYTLQTPGGPSNTVMIGYARSPLIAEVEPNNTPQQAQKITLPVELAGAFQQRGDVDLYQFDAKAGEAWWFEVQGQRLGSGCDPYMTIDQVTVNAEGQETLKRIAAVDDDATNHLPIVFDTIHDDPAYKFTAPADGTYRIALRDRYGASRGSPTLQYRLTARPEEPDFRVVVITEARQPVNQKNPQTWAAGLRRGDQFPVWVVVLRQDGFDGDVDISVSGLPQGVTCRDISVGAKPSQGLLVFESAEDAAKWAGTVQVTGKAKIADPVKVVAVTQAAAGLKAARDALPAAEKAVEKPAADLQQAEQALKAARDELAGKPDDEAAKKKVADAEAKQTAAKTAHDTVVAAHKAAEQKVADAEKALAAAEQARDGSAKDVTRAARYGTIAWSGGNNIPGRARLTDGLELSVIEEEAPFQVRTDVHREVVNHGRQILIPVTAARRAGFDNDIPLTFVGQPQNVQIENKPIKKGTTEEVFRVFVPPNAAEGTYVLHMAAQAQVAHRRNPQRVEVLKAELDTVDKLLKDADEAQKAAAAKRDESTKQVATAQETLKQATAAKATADKALTDAQAAEKAAAEAVAKAGEDENAKAEATKKLEEAQAAVKTATEAVTTAEKDRVAAETGVKDAETAKTAAEAAFKAADDKVKSLTAEKAAATKRHTDADNAAKPKNVNFMPTSTPIVLTIKSAPYTLTAAPADGGKLKRGGTVEVKVGIKRQNDFTGPVTLTLAVPPNVQGVTAAPVTVPADQAEGVLVIAANGEATEGALANLVVRVVSQFQGEAAVDQPVSITVSK